MNQQTIKQTFTSLCDEREKLQIRLHEISYALRKNAEQCTHPNRETPTSMNYDISCPDCGDRIYCWPW